jgi:hypothetical protein
MMPRSPKDVAFDAAVKPLLDEHGWKVAGGGFVYRVRGDYIYWLNMARPRRGPLRGTLQTKPLALDPVFWDIVGLPELQSRRPAFRLQGAFTLPTAIIAEAEHEFDLADPPAAIESVFAELQEAFVQSETTYRTLSDFASVLDRPDSTSEHKTSLRIVWLIASGRGGEAERLVRGQVTSGKYGGFYFGGDASFNELARRYLVDRTSPPTEGIDGAGQG